MDTLRVHGVAAVDLHEVWKDGDRLTKRGARLERAVRQAQAGALAHRLDESDIHGCHKVHRALAVVNLHAMLVGLIGSAVIEVALGSATDNVAEGLPGRDGQLVSGVRDVKRANAELAVNEFPDDLHALLHPRKDGRSGVGCHDVAADDREGSPAVLDNGVLLLRLTAGHKLLEVLLEVRAHRIDAAHVTVLLGRHPHHVVGAERQGVLDVKLPEASEKLPREPERLLLQFFPHLIPPNKVPTDACQA